MSFFKIEETVRRAAVLVISICMFLAPLVMVPSVVEANPGPTDWMIVIVDAEGNVGFHSSLAIDSNDRMHISYYDKTNGDLKYATNAEGFWVHTTLYSTGDVGFTNSIAVDSNNNVHICFYDTTNANLMYAANLGGGWSYQTIDSAGDVGFSNSIAVDSNNNVHICYQDNTTYDLKYATNAAGSWSCQTLDNEGWVGFFPTIAVDSNDKVHVGYYDGTNGDLKYATNASGSWIYQTIDRIGIVGYWPSLAIDTNDKVHIGYCDLTNYDLKYATNAGGSWVNQTIDSTDEVGACTSIAIDSNNKAHISYMDATNFDLKMTTNIMGPWDIEVVSSTGSVGWFGSIALDSNERAYISFHDWDNGELKYATKKPGNVEIQVLEEPNEVGQANSLALDSIGVCHVSYFDTTNGYLKYATNPGGVWSYETVDSEGLFGYYTSLAIDSNDNVHISYFDITNNGLKYATNIGGTWNCMLIDSGDQVGYFNSIAIDSNDKVHISYMDTTNCDLKYATNAGGSWSCQAVDSSPDQVGHWTSIALDSHNKPHITYFNQTYWCVMYATNAGGSWVCQPVPGQIDGDHSSIAVDSNDKVHICFHQYSGHELKYATCDSGIWALQKVDDENLVTQCSLALDSEGNAHIAYHTGPTSTNEDLKYATNTNGVWSSMTLIRKDNPTVWEPSIAIDSDIRVHIVYYDYPSADLKYILMYIRPSMPLGFSASEGDSYVQLDWLPPVIDVGYPVGGYAIYRGLQEDQMIQVDWTALTEFNDTSVTNGQTYYYKVKAFNLFGQGASTQVLMAVPGTVPSQPVSLQAEAGDSCVHLNWSAPLEDGGYPIEGYGIYRGLEETSMAYIAVVGATDFHDTSVVNGNTYYYQVRAINVMGEGEPSDIVNATPATIPSSPQGLQAEVGDSYVLLNWLRPADDGGMDIEGFNIYKGTSESSLSLLTPVLSLSFNDTSVVNGNTYYYRVSAFNPLGEGPMSNMVDALPQADIVHTVPSAPLGLEAHPGNGYITLSWSPPEDNGGATITHYTIYRGTSSGSETLLITIESALEFMDDTVTNGVTYFYQVSAVNSIGEGPFSNEASATPVEISPPSAPTITGCEAGDSYIHLTWSAPESDGGSPIEGYKIYRGASELSLETLTVMIGNEFNDTSVTNGVTYFYQVSAFNPMGEGEGSNIVNATPVTVPSAPQSLQSEAGDLYVLLTWISPSDDGGSEIEGYNVYKGESESPLEFLVFVETLDYNDTSVTNGVTYYYRVTALNSLGEGPVSNLINATPQTGIIKTIPSAPQNLQAEGGASEILLTWSAPESNGGATITHYAIYRGISSGSESYLTTVNNTLEFIDTLVTNGITYYYQVSAVNSMGEGPLSNEAFATPSVSTAPSVPQEVTVTAGDANITLGWSPPEDDGGSPILHYRIYRGTTSGSEILLATIGNVFTYTDTGLINGQTYYYKVSAINEVGEGPLSSEVSATPLAPIVPTVPAAPQDPQASSGEGYVQLIWDAPSDDGGSDITSYNIYRGTDQDSLTLLASVPATQTSYNDTSVESGQTYYYRITAVNDEGESPQSTMIVDTPDEGGDEGTGDNTIVIVAGVLVALAVIAVLVFILRRK